ncbi:formin domain-containing protein [Cavenderia fasciculata]|uniref:Formin domain-containing protein n=1 Tax=Cavenderia fasciculata TaxID=261658 RepID=F4QFH8_CACFS|nr:formin domain-containing protein [Cavenderia fasciculata]EGG14279.1 formin domain-containing protein [Cavenderia fasciculata]|eukprot:XP_004350988.1 formin domain-containing protein [Cavenderia fasciculata]
MNNPSFIVLSLKMKRELMDNFIMVLPGDLQLSPPSVSTTTTNSTSDNNNNQNDDENNINYSIKQLIINHTKQQTTTTPTPTPAPTPIPIVSSNPLRRLSILRSNNNITNILNSNNNNNNNKNNNNTNTNTNTNNNVKKMTDVVIQQPIATTTGTSVTNNNNNNPLDTNNLDVPTSSWFSSLFSNITKRKKSNYENEMDAFKDALLFVRPINNEEGILVHKLDKSKKYIHSLGNLDIGFVYLTEKDTTLLRQNEDQVTLANKLIIQCKSFKRYSITGILQQDIVTMALENFTKRKITQGMLFIEEDGQLCRIFYRMNDLIMNTVYASHDDTVLLQRLPNGEVRFRFEGTHSHYQIEQSIIAQNEPSNPKDWKRITVLREQYHHSKQPTPPSESITTKFLNKFQSRSKNEQKELKQKRESTINKLKSRMNINLNWEWNKEETVDSEDDSDSDNGEDDKENVVPPNNLMSSLVTKVRERISRISAADKPTTITPKVTTSASSYIVTPPVNMQPVSVSAAPTTEETVLMVPAPPAPPAPPPPPPPAPPAPPINKLLRVNKKNINEKKMRQLHWSVVPKDKLKESLWDSLSPVKSNERDQSLVESWFSLSPLPKTQKSLIGQSDNTGTDSTTATTAAKPVAVQLLDLRRANNACILLSQFKLSFSAIREAIISYDESKLSVEQLIALDAMLPITEEESIALSSFSGDRNTLGTAERFFFEVMDITRLQARIQTYLFRAEIDTQMVDIERSVGAIATTLQQLKDSGKLVQILKIILHVGTILNRGTYLNGRGFRMDSLAKLSETKSKDQKHSVIDFIETYVRQNRPELMDFATEFGSLEATAGGAPLETIVEDVESLAIRMAQVKEELEYHAEHPAASELDNYTRVMQPFYQDRLQTIIKLQHSLTAVQKQFQELLVYFGEDSTNTSKEFFTNILKFVVAFKKISILHDQQLARQSKTSSSSKLKKNTPTKVQKKVEAAIKVELELNQLLQQKENDLVESKVVVVEKEKEEEKEKENESSSLSTSTIINLDELQKQVEEIQISTTTMMENESNSFDLIVKKDGDMDQNALERCNQLEEQQQQQNIINI